MKIKQKVLKKIEKKINYPSKKEDKLDIIEKLLIGKAIDLTLKHARAEIDKIKAWQPETNLWVIHPDDLKKLKERLK